MAWQEVLIGKCRNGGWGQGGAVTGLRPDLLLFHPALLPVVTQGKEVVLAKAGDLGELPCKTSQEKNMAFSWKYPSGIKILGSTNSFLPATWVTGRVSWLPIQEEKHYGWNISHVRTPNVHYVIHTLEQSSGPQLPQTASGFSVLEFYSTKLLEISRLSVGTLFIFINFKVKIT